MKRIDLIEGFILFLLTVLVYIFTIHPLTRQYNIFLLAAIFLFFLTLLITNKKNSQVFIFVSIFLILTLVGITGWFGSPLFSWLYVLAIAISFVFSEFVANIFALILVLLFLPSLRSFDLTFELLTIFSLLLIIPVADFLRNKYLSLKEKENDILILKNENKEYGTKLSEILANKVSKESVDLKEPINDIKQMISFYKATKKPMKQSDYSKIIDLTNKSLRIIDDFEEKATGEELAKTK
jgi:signal transduction histidine kinase